MANENTVALEFYSPWPLFGKKLSEQLGEIRTDTSALAPVVRGIGLDASGDFTTLDAIENTAIQAWEIGEQDFHNRFRTHYNKTTDVFEIASNTGTTQVPNWYTTWWIDKDGLVTQQNTPTTASNQGPGTGVFKQKSGVDLEFKSLRAFYPLSIREQSNTIDFHTGAERNTYSSVVPDSPSGGTGGILGILANTGKVGVNFPFKAIEAGANAVVTDTGNTIRFESTAQVVEFYGITLKHHDDSFVRRGTHMVAFHHDNFYLSPSSRTDESLVNLIDRYVDKSGDTMTGQLFIPDGTAAAPAIAFADETDTGLRRRAANDFAFVTSGVDRLRIQDSLIFGTVPFHAADSTVALPGYAFASDPNTGLFQQVAGDDSIGFTVGGVKRAELTVSGLEVERVNSGHGEFYGYLSIAKGTSTTPTLRFRNDPDTGISGNDANLLGFITGGVRAGHFDSNQDFNVVKQIIAGDGNVSAPAFTFNTDKTDGIYLANTNSIVIALNGVNNTQFQTTAMFQPVPFRFNYNAALADGDAAAPAYSFNPDNNTGIYQNSSDDDSLAFTTGGTRAGYFDSSQIFFVTNEIRAGDGAVGDPAYSFSASGQTDVGMYRSATDVLSFATGGIRAGYFDEQHNLFVTNAIYAANFYAITDITVRGIVRGSTANFDKLGADLDANNFDIIGAGNIDSDRFTLSRGVQPPDIRIGTSGSNKGISFFTVGSQSMEILEGGAVIVTGAINADRFVADLDGTNSAPAFRFDSDTDTGMYRSTANTLEFTTGGTRAGFFDAQQNFHVTNSIISGNDIRANAFYIGTTIHRGELSITKQGHLNIDSGANDLFLSTAAGGDIFVDSAADANFRTVNNAGLLTIDSDGFMTITCNKNMTISATDASRSIKLDATLEVQVDNCPIRASQDELVDAPAYSFTSDTDTGMYRKGTNQLGFGTKGIEAGYFDDGQDFHVTNEILVPRVEAGFGNFYVDCRATRFFAHRAETAGAGDFPGFAFTDDQDTGMYLDDPGDLRLTVDGIPSIAFQSERILPLQAIEHNLAGTAAAPAYSWAADDNTGIWRDANDEISFATGGTKAGHFDQYQNFYVANSIYVKDVIEADSGQFYSSILLDNRSMKFGNDGVLYAWDSPRQKYLSVDRTFVHYGRNASITTDLWLSHQGGAVTTGGGTAFVAVRDFTVLSVIAMADSVTNVDTDITLQKGDEGAVANTVLETVTVLIGTRPQQLVIGLDHDYNKGERMNAKALAATSGGTIADPTLQVELAWRLNK